MGEQSRILVVDDDPVDRDLCSMVLQGAGFEVRVSASGEEGVELARQFRPDLILLDVVLPGSSGFEVCQKIKSEPHLRDVLVAFHSGLETNTEHRAGGLEKGADDYIVKTPNRREFLARIRTLLRLRDATALRAVEQHYQRLIDILPEAAALMDTQGRLIAANDHAVHLLGFADAIALVARNFFDLIIPREHERLRADMAITLHRGRSSNTQYTILHSDGQAFPAETSAATIQGPRGQIIGLLVVIRDITERMRAAEALRSSEERFRQLAENIREVFWMTDVKKKRMIYISPGYESLWGRTCESLYAAPDDWMAAIHPNDLARVMEAATGQASGGYDEVYRIVRPDGSVRWIEDRAFPIRDEKGEVYRLVGIAEDVTRSEEALQALLEAEAKYRSIFENSIEGIFQTTPAGRYLSANPALARMLGYASPEELIKSVKDLGQQVCVRPKSREEFRQRLETEGHVTGFENQIYTKDGSVRWHRVNARAVRDATGAVIFYEGTSEDITDRKEAESRLATLGHAVESTAEMICITDSENRFTFANQAFLDSYGYSFDELQGKRPDVLSSTKNPKRITEEIYQQTRLGGWKGELTNCSKDGRELLVQLHTSLIKDSRGDILGLMGVARDISEQKRTEKQNEAFAFLGHRLSSVVTPNQAAEVILDVAGDLFEWDSAYLHLYSEATDKITRALTMDMLEGRRVPVPAARATDEPTPLMRRIMKEGAQLINRETGSGAPESFVRFGNVNRLSASLMFTPVRSGEAVVGILSIQSYTPQAYSNTDLKLLESLAAYCGDALRRIEIAEALTKADAKYRSIFENATEGIFQTTPEGRYQSANPALAGIFGYDTPEELIVGVTDIEQQTYVHPERREEMKRLLQKQGSVTGFEAERIRKDGKRIWVTVNARAIKDESSRVLYYEGTNRDVTGLKQTEEELRRLPRRIIEAQEAERQRVARDLHDSVNQVIASAKMRLRKVTEILGPMKPASREILERCDQLLVQALEENRRIAYDLRPNDLDQLGLSEACRNFCRQFESRTSVSVHCRFPRQMDRFSPATELNLFRILQETLSNIERHAHAKTVRVSLSMEDAHILLKIQDDGKGFVPGTQKKSSKRGGIGLTNIRERTTLLKGTCQIESEPNRGTGITVRVPASQPK